MQRTRLKNIRLGISKRSEEKMKVLIAGASGLIGSAVDSHLSKQGYEITRLVRRDAGPGEVCWDPDGNTIDADGLEGFDGVVHVASMSWSGRWTPEFKKRIRSNHVGTIQLIAKTLAYCHQKPEVLICASGMGIYSASGNQVITEDSPLGTGFLAELQRDGEAAGNPAVTAGIRVIHLRIPMVLGGPNLSILAANMRRGFGRLGNGRQWCSWVHETKWQALSISLCSVRICLAQSMPLAQIR
jgi:NAD dependent epimerase/dehydratase family enzyme